MLNENQKIPADSMYYVYVLIDPRNEQPFYVGKGKGKRVTSHYYNRASDKTDNPHKFKKIQKLKKLGYGPKYEIVFESSDEQAVLNEEKKLIQKWGRHGHDEGGILTNIRSGDEVSRKMCSPVKQYNLFGEYIRSFPSCIAAAQFCGQDGSSMISACCKTNGGYKSTGGYFWSYENEQLDLEWCFRKKRPVYQWDLYGNYVNRYPNAHIAKKSIFSEKPSSGKIYQSARTGCVSFGFRWTFDFESPGPYVPINRSQKVVAFKCGLLVDYRPKKKKSTGRVVRPVKQYTLSGEYIQTFPRLMDAAKAVGKQHSSMIVDCCRKRGCSQSAHGYFWSYAEEDLNLDRCFGGKKKPVYQWDLEGNFVNRFVSANRAAIEIQKPASFPQILKSAKTLKTICQGFRWTFDNKSPGKLVKN